MKQTQTHVWSLAGEEAVTYSLARGKAAAVTRESGEVAAYSEIIHLLVILCYYTCITSYS